MPDTKITALTAISTVDPAVDVLPIVDVSDTTMAASGTTKKITTNQILGAGGTATLASATVTGAATAARLIVTGSTIPANGVYLPAANTVGFAANSLDQYRIEPLGVFTWYDGAGGTRMTLNSTGLGVGGSPFSKLSIIDTTNNFPGCFRGAGGGNTNFVAIGTTTSGASINGFTAGFAATADLILQPNGGNVGVGVAPSAWSGYGAPVIQMTSGGTFVAAGSVTVASNFYYSGGQFRYIANSTASYYFQNSGQHIWYTAPSGTAGNAITFSQVMTLDANGNLILKSSNTPATLANNGELTVNATSNTNLRFSYRGSDGVTRVANLTLA